MRSCLWGWGGVGWSGFCNTDRVACGPVCGVGVGWGGMGFVTQTVLRAVLSVEMGWGGMWFATMTVTSVSVGLGWGRVCNTAHVMSWTHRAISCCCQCTMT